MNIKEKLKLNNLQAAFLLVAVVLTTFGLIETILHLGADVPKSKTIFICLSYVTIIYYVFYGYKVPHGNSLKYIMLFFALMLVNAISLEAGGKYPALDSQKIMLSVMITGICIILVSYASGRLDRFEKNIYLFVLVLIMLFVRAVIMVNYKTLMFAYLSDMIIWIDIICAYSIRYTQHKEAGLKAQA